MNSTRIFHDADESQDRGQCHHRINVAKHPSQGEKCCGTGRESEHCPQAVLKRAAFRLRSFSTNPRKEIAKSQKVFFWDTGIRNALFTAFSTDEFRPDIGALWKNWVIAEAAKHNALAGSPAELFFWRTRTQSEVDLVVQQGSKLRAFEVKWSPGRVSGRAFRDAYGVEVEVIRPDNPFATDIFKTPTSRSGS